MLINIMKNGYQVSSRLNMIIKVMKNNYCQVSS